MTKLVDIVEKIRSKNAGPFWITVDIFCGDPETFAFIREVLTVCEVQKLLKVESQCLKKFEIPDLFVVKFSFHRREAQGSGTDRDMHGAQIASLFSELKIPRELS